MARPCCGMCQGDVKELLEEKDGLYGEIRLKKWDEKTGMVVRQEIRRCLNIRKRPGTTLHCSGRGQYEGPYRVIHTRIEYTKLERGLLCVHLSKGEAHFWRPRYVWQQNYKSRTGSIWTSSNANPPTRSLQLSKLPKHFFEQWSGYNVGCRCVKPYLWGTTQFYAFYSYRSPVLLVEQCREQSVDDR
jgi:hypothetical protein